MEMVFPYMSTQIKQVNVALQLFAARSGSWHIQAGHPLELRYQQQPHSQALSNLEPGFKGVRPHGTFNKVWHCARRHTPIRTNTMATPPDQLRILSLLVSVFTSFPGRSHLQCLHTASGQIPQVGTGASDQALEVGTAWELQLGHTTDIYGSTNVILSFLAIAVVN